ncbi:eukaryotic translation initiation factor 4E [Microthyrium microscopicum]|uniref:Eukaryotic translation initiation factor 4E n=1 Tax=Microthyrium microscopicum TaxID=703497 RepID=A0A6A6UL32_9PEZI|nr:eukaryotic translation initiation factor 4E [Microthyrium microscopicum]
MASVASHSSSPVPLDTIPISPEDGSNDNASKIDASIMAAIHDPSSVRTVFHDSDNFNVKHPLMNTWTLWFTKPPTANDKNWNDLLKEVISFDSVEEFWGIYNNITPTSDLAVKSDYHLFKQGVRPEWEDLQNKHGGKWAYQFKDKKSVNIDNLWLHIMLAAIGETLEDEDDNEIMGVVVNVRKGFYRIGLWTRSTGAGGKRNAAPNNAGADTLMKIGRRFKETLSLEEADKVEFSGHTDSAHAGSTRAKAKYSC